jgi:hypothetical protein
MSGKAFSCFERVDQMNIEPVDLGDELREGVQFRLLLAPVALSPPIARELLNRPEWHALRLVRDDFAIGPTDRVYAPAQFDKFRIRKFTRNGRMAVLSAPVWCPASDAVMVIPHN